MGRKMLVIMLLFLMSGGSALAAEQLCGQFDSTNVAGGIYKVQNNVWGAGTSQCVSAVNETGFVVDTSSHNNGTSGLPASYPSIWRGCHWDDCTVDSGMPIQASEVADARFSWEFKTITSGAWNATAEAWFKKTSTPGAPDGTELRIWLNHNGPVQPGGSNIATITLEGTQWEVWFTNSPGWNYVTYRRITPVNSALIDMKPFMDDAINRGYLDPNWFMMDMEAGFEIWQGGAGLQTDAFSYEVNGDPTGNHRPAAKIEATPLSGEPPLAVSFSGEASSDVDGDDLTYMWDFGDNSTGSGSTLEHIYTEPGKYTATLSVNDGSLSGSASVEVVVQAQSSGEGVSCEYIVSNEWNSGFTGLIRLTNNGNTAVNGWEVSWHYTDGSKRTNGWNANVTGSNPYTASPVDWNSEIQPGQSVEFGFIGEKGKENTAAPVSLVTGDVCGVGSTNRAPEVNAHADVISGIAPLKVAFSADESVDADGDSLTYTWDFGDGESSKEINPVHTYLEPGDYTVTIVVSDGKLTDEATLAITVEEAMGNSAPVAIVTSSILKGTAPLQVEFDATKSKDMDGDSLTYFWDFGDGESANVAAPVHTFKEAGKYSATVSVSDGQATDTATLEILVTDGTADGGAGFDNPFTGAKLYRDPIWSAKTASEPGGDAIAQYNTAVWMDRIGALTDGIGLRGHLDEAVAQGVDLFMFVVYNLPNRDCAALASNGELRISEDGFERYKKEYIAPLVEILSDPAYSDLRIVAVVEVDSLPNLVTNLDVPDCREANGPGGYKDGIQYALNALAKVDNVYAYVDVAHSGWMGWQSNFGPAVSLISEVVVGTEKGWGSIAGFVTNVANYTPVEEPFMKDPQVSVGGQPIRSSSFYEWNDYLDEKSYAQAWRKAMIAKGAPESIGMLIDTARNGWGGKDRPTQMSTSTDMEQFVVESRIDRRNHRGNWCNQPGGIGYRPSADPYPGIDAFVWVKPPGESDGISTPNFEPDPDDPAKQHDPMCDPDASNRYDPSVSTGAMADAPHAGRWFPEALQVLMENAYPAL